MKKRHKRVWNTYIFLTSTDESGSVTERQMKKKQKQNQLQKRSQNAQKAGEDFAAVAAELGTEVQKTAFDAKSTSPDAALIEAANALAAEGDVTGAIESDAGGVCGKADKPSDREATDQKRSPLSKSVSRNSMILF